jgi:uncharacterized protein YggE
VLAAAVDEARAKGQALATKTGAALGPLLSIESRSYGYDGPRYWGPGSRVPFDPGENEVYASVVVTFAIS